MLTVALIFVCQFVYVLMLGLQQLNVAGRHYCGAATVSLLLGTIGYQLTATIAQHSHDAIGSPIWCAYVSSGPVAICVAIAVHPWLVQRFGGKA